MNIDKVRKIVKVVLMSFNVFCIGGITYTVFIADFSNLPSLKPLLIFAWLMYLSNDILRKINN